MFNCKKKEFFYLINYNSERDKELCELEMKYIFGYIPKYRHILSSIDTKPSRSPYIKEKIDILIDASSLEELIVKINENNTVYDDYKVIYLKSGNLDVNYNERLRAVRLIAMAVKGKANIHDAKVVLGVSKVGEKWIFGLHQKDDFKWHEHDKRPYSYSNALPTSVAKSIVNIAVCNNYNLKVIDPCCGVGTVLIEALDLGIDIKGYEINSQIAYNAKENLKFFGFPDVVEQRDMTKSTEKFDVVILDMPYGLFTATTKEIQKSLLDKAMNLAPKLVLVETEEFDDYLENLGYKIIDKCTISKNKFKRHILVCEVMGGNNEEDNRDSCSC
jgi:tRNA G10  N-methylase Trm11